MTVLSKKELTHQRILETAAKVIRRDGFDALAVADVMKQAGLTHGGFYAHFSNRDALLAEALDYARIETATQLEQWVAHKVAEGQQPLSAFIDIYLSEQHLNNCVEGAGCPVAALGSDFFRLDPGTKAIAAKTIETYVEKVRALSKHGLTKDQAFLLISTLAGAMQLARSFIGTEQASLYLTACRNDLIQRYTFSQ
jgi:TetR/AcrR family transcriptional regulator, transcriptional repressor for nem operon